MKYFTKAWYELSQKTGIHFLLEEDEKAQAFSEEYFQDLYEQKLKNWLELQERAASCSFEEIFPEEIAIENFGDNISQEEIEVIKASYREQRELAKERFDSREPFDREKAAKQFHEAFLFNQGHYRNILPGEILDNIADIRVFALGRASRQVIDAVTRFCENNQEQMAEVIREYRKYYESAAESFEESIVQNLNFHDCVILDLVQSERSLSIFFDHSAGFTDIDEVRFDNYEILKLEDSLKKAWWLYDELYRTNDKYELHVLLQSKTGKLIEFIVSAENMAFHRSRKPGQ